ncbi:cadherin repeat domain-containing protein [Serratia fonticola]|uniref:hypothetical protein n=1 Tax=Serratia fonticola TaxID=47917 RepID=UPI0021BACE6F|nr:hypothetical protein [Serratia fonticola]
MTVRLVERSGDLVTYSFSDENGREGRFFISQKTGELTLKSPMPNDLSKTYFARAARKVVTDWKKNGRLPEKAVWAS